ncbi:hypothetical protein K439DRAFT_1399184 [Ramaria rubella]|nr:hypothetical protein K439DRAFT_1399184 [Ramaria rubella]
MDADRRSNVSSFYDPRGRGSPFDPNQVLAPHQQPTSHRPRMDSTTSSAYANPNRMSQNSADILTGDMGSTPGLRGTAGSAGYNRTSFFAPGRVAPVKGGADERLPLHQADVMPSSQDEGWDVYADFNNAGPRYSSAFAAGDKGYRQIPVGASKPETPGSESGTPVELVTVPALGAEWKSSELRAMTKSGKREVRAEKFGAKWRAFRRDENGFCGIKWLTRRLFVIILFGFCVVVGLVLAFTVPRVPGMAFNNNTPLSGSSNVVFSRTPANFSFDTNLNLQIDTNGNFLPLHFNHIHAQVFETDTNQQIATGDISDKTLPAKTFNPLLFPVTFNFTAVNDTDQTWLNVYDACRNPENVPAGQDRPPLKIRIVLQMFIAGLVSHPFSSAAIDGAPCPFQLPTNSV